MSHSRGMSSEQFPEGKSLNDAEVALARGVWGSIPLIGAAATELFNFVVTPSLEKRRVEWLNALADRMKQVESEVAGFSIEALVDRPDFVSAMLTASQIAMRTHDDEKLAALKSAVVNVARGSAPGEDLQSVFLSFVDYLTPLHLRLLRLFVDPVANMNDAGKSLGNIMMGGPSLVVETMYPGLARELYDPVWTDLYNRGLVNTEGLHTTMTAGGVVAKRTSALGDQFLRFITDR